MSQLPTPPPAERPKRRRSQGAQHTGRVSESKARGRRWGRTLFGTSIVRGRAAALPHRLPAEVPDRPAARRLQLRVRPTHSVLSETLVPKRPRL